MTYSESPTLAVISRAFITRRRIVQNAQTAIALVFMAAIFATPRGIWLAVVVLSAAVVLAFVRPGVQRLIRTITPQHLQARLPYGPLDARETPGAPHSYGDLLKIWRDPNFHCGHQPNLSVHLEAPWRLVIGPALLLYIVAACGVITAASFLAFERKPGDLPRTSLSIAACLSVVVLEVSLTVLWQRALRRRGFDVPSTTDIWVTSFVATAIAVVAVMVIFIRAA